MAITDDNLWLAEESLWTGRPEDFADGLAHECLMVFPQMGVMDRSAALEGLKGAPRWSTIDMTDRAVVRPGKEVAVLAYRASARRETGEPYDAFCSSTYRGGDDGWKLVQHQQTVAQ